MNKQIFDLGMDNQIRRNLVILLPFLSWLNYKCHLQFQYFAYNFAKTQNIREIHHEYELIRK